jgi:hypothetical protein
VRSSILKSNGSSSKKNALLLLAGAICVGCSREPAPLLQPAKGAQPNLAGAEALASPEVVISRLETSEDRANYLRELGRDKSFDPQKHADFLKKFTSDPDQEVALAAQELLDRQ